MVSERDSKEILSSGEQESRNLDEYFDDSEGVNEKVSKKRKSKNSSPRKHSCENVAARSKQVKVSETRKTFLQRMMIVKLRTRKARNKKNKLRERIA